MYLDVWSHEQKQSIRNGHAILASQMLIKQAGTKVKDEQDGPSSGNKLG